MTAYSGAPRATGLTPGETAVAAARVLAGRGGDIAVLGLRRSGTAVSRLLFEAGMHVYASDAATDAEVVSNSISLGKLGVRTETGGHDAERIQRADLVITSPGIPPDAPPLVAARSACVPVISEVEAALRLAPGIRVIATTGTNGKTTTTAIIGHLLRSLGYRAVDAGNIGVPVSEVVLEEPHPDWISLEVSSFQLHDSPGFHPSVGVLTALSPDHLDRYRSVEDYYADKRMMFANAHAGSRWVINADSPESVAMTAGVPGHVYTFSLGNRAADAYLDAERDVLMVMGEPVLHRRLLQLTGDHNVMNALAALLAVVSANGSHATTESYARLGAALPSFRPLPNRLEPVAEGAGILWVNDSKATNVASTLMALKGMTRPSILLLGGRHKGEPYTLLADEIRRCCRAVIAYGEACRTIERDLAPKIGEKVRLITLPDADFGEVLDVASATAIAGDVVLLSPACSSYDMFPNYEVRGAVFSEYARGKS